MRCPLYMFSNPTHLKHLLLKTSFSPWLYLHLRASHFTFLGDKFTKFSPCMKHLIHVQFGTQLGDSLRKAIANSVSPLPAVVELSPGVRSPSSFYFQFLCPLPYSGTIFPIFPLSFFQNGHTTTISFLSWVSFMHILHTKKWP
jgi:hypothetical protein